MDAEPIYAPLPTLADLLRILRRRLPLIGMTIAIVMASAVGYLLIATPYYASTAEILIDPRKKNTVQNEVVPSGLGTTAGDNFALVDSQVKVILSDAVLRPVVRSQHLANDPEFNGQMPGFLSSMGALISDLFGASTGVPFSPEERALWTLRQELEVTRDSQAYVIKIAVRTMGAVKSARLAQAIAESYLEDQSETKIETTQQVSSQMDGQLAALRDRLLEAETKVQQFRAKHNLQQAAGELIDTRQLGLLNEQLTRARAEVAEKQAKSQQIQRLLKEGVDPEAVGDVIKSETISKLRDQYANAARREAILGASLLPSHPQMQQARSDVARLRALIGAEVQRISHGIDLDYETAKQRLASTEAALATSRHAADTNDSAYIKLSELQRDAETTRAVYQSFVSRVKTLNETQSVYAPDARIISPAAIPEKPVWPKKFLVLALALVFGGVLGCTFALLREHLDPRIHSGTELLTSTGLKPLVSIPRLNGKQGLLGRFAGQQKQSASFYDLVLETLEGNPRSGFRAAVLRLLSYLLDFDAAGKPRVVLLTSSLSGEGKSALALSLAVAASSAGIRTLLVDASATDPALTKVIGKSDDAPELANQVITDQALGLSFLSLANLDSEPAGWSSRHTLTEQLSDLTKGYELTLIDGGLLYCERNAAALIASSQAILFLSRASVTSQEAASFAASDLLQMANGRRCAAVLTMAGAEQF